MSSGGAKADRSTVSAASLGGSTPDEYTAVKNSNAHFSGNIDEVAPHDDDEEPTATTTTRQQSSQRSGNGSDEGWDAAKIKAADTYNAAKDKASEYMRGGDGGDGNDKVDDSSISKSAKGVAAKVTGAAADAADKTSAAADVASKKAYETAAAASAKAGRLYESAHDSIQQQTGSEKPLRQQASEKAADISARAKDAAASASESASQYGTTARAKAGEVYSQAHDSIQAKTGSDQPLRQQAAAKASEWASTLEAAAGTAKEKIVEYAGIAQSKAAEAYKSASSSLGMSGGSSSADQTVTTSTYESRERIVDKDDSTGTAKVAKHETWTEQTNNGPKKENSKDSEYTTTVGADGKL
jgi:hypothetical protein